MSEERTAPSAEAVALAEAHASVRSALLPLSGLCLLASLDRPDAAPTAAAVLSARESLDRARTQLRLAARSAAPQVRASAHLLGSACDLLEAEARRTGRRSDPEESRRLLGEVQRRLARTAPTALAAGPTRGGCVHDRHHHHPTGGTTDDRLVDLGAGVQPPAAPAVELAGHR